MTFPINSHSTFEGVDFRASPNIGERFTSTPDLIILHYTATIEASRAIYMLSDPSREVSAHLVIDRNGHITQLVPFDTIAWHAGKSKWKERESLNKCSIGIEIVNAGPLTLKGKSFYTWDDIEVPNSEVQARINKHSAIEYWHKYPKEQLASVKLVCMSLIQNYKIKEILSHQEIAPKRKIDPGPVFPLQKFKYLVDTY